MDVPCPSPVLREAHPKGCPKYETRILVAYKMPISDLGRVPARREGLCGFVSYFYQIGFLFLQHVFRIQIPGRAWVTAEAFMHVLAVNFEREEQIFIGRV
jgi:hypothetical protein